MTNIFKKLSVSALLLNILACEPPEDDKKSNYQKAKTEIVTKKLEELKKKGFENLSDSEKVEYKKLDLKLPSDDDTAGRRSDDDTIYRCSESLKMIAVEEVRNPHGPDRYMIIKKDYLFLKKQINKFLINLREDSKYYNSTEVGIFKELESLLSSEFFTFEKLDEVEILFNKSNLLKSIRMKIKYRNPASSVKKSNFITEDERNELKHLEFERIFEKANKNLLYEKNYICKQLHRLRKKESNKKSLELEKKLEAELKELERTLEDKREELKRKSEKDKQSKRYEYLKKKEDSESSSGNFFDFPFFFGIKNELKNQHNKDQKQKHKKDEYRKKKENSEFNFNNQFDLFFGRKSEIFFNEEDDYETTIKKAAKKLGISDSIVDKSLKEIENGTYENELYLASKDKNKRRDNKTAIFIKGLKHKKELENKLEKINKNNEESKKVEEELKMLQIIIDGTYRYPEVKEMFNIYTIKISDSEEYNQQLTNREEELSSKILNDKEARELQIIKRIRELLEREELSREEILEIGELRTKLEFDILEFNEISKTISNKNKIFSRYDNLKRKKRLSTYEKKELKKIESDIIFYAKELPLFKNSNL